MVNHETKTVNLQSGGVLYRFVAYPEPASIAHGPPKPVDWSEPAREPVEMVQLTKRYAVILLRDAVAISGKSIGLLPDSMRFIAREMGITDDDISAT